MRSSKSVSNAALVNRLRKLVTQEQTLTRNILPLLVEVERRGLYAAKHHCSLYEYCKKERVLLVPNMLDPCPDSQDPSSAGAPGAGGPRGSVGACVCHR